jgi:hypothetical protein
MQRTAPTYKTMRRHASQAEENEGLAVEKTANDQGWQLGLIWKAQLDRRFRR